MGMTLRSWTFLKASSDICRLGAADCAPACTYPGRPQAGERTAVRCAVGFEGSVETAAARMDIPVPPLTNATPIAHAIAAATTTSLICLDPICMLSPSSHSESNPSSAGAHGEPEHQRHDGDDLQPDRPHVPLGGERD